MRSRSGKGAAKAVLISPPRNNQVGMDGAEMAERGTLRGAEEAEKAGERCLCLAR